jgi:nucleotide-binding universal stress UspA family protein
MTYASILTAVCGALDDADAVAVAADLAKRHGASLKVLNAIPQVGSGPLGYSIGLPVVSGQVAQALIQAERDLETRTLALVAHEAERFGLEKGTDGGTRWAMARSAPSPWLSLAEQLPLADLLVVAQSAARNDGPWTGLLASALMEARAPVLIARGQISPFGRPAAIAWDGSLEAGRAVKAAIAMLKDASDVVLLQDPDGLDPDRACVETDRLIEYLGHHGIGPMTVVKVTGRDESRALLEGASNVGAALLVAGAFGHARVREAVFGGATRSFLKDDNGPHLFLAH